MLVHTFNNNGSYVMAASDVFWHCMGLISCEVLTKLFADELKLLTSTAWPPF